MPQKVNMESLLPFIEEAFSRGFDFKIPITGKSMNPLFYEKRDFVKIVKPTLPLKVGDIPLYRRDDGNFILHRVVGIKDSGEYIMCGDNQIILEYGITDKNIIGVVKTLIIDGKEIDAESDEKYLKYKEKYIKNIKTRYPLRRLRVRLYRIKTNLFPNENTVTEDEKVKEKKRLQDDLVSTGKLLIKVIKAEIEGEKFDFPEGTDFSKLYKLAKKHKVAAFIAPVVLDSADIDNETKNIFKKEMFFATARNTAQESERQELSKLFAERSIKHCFLKGTKIGSFYSSPELRFMVDMDLYVVPEKIDEVGEILLSRGYNKNQIEDNKDTAFIKKPFLTIELHKELKYDYDKGYDYYKSAFERMVPDEGSAVKMTDEDFYVYILSHTAHHFATAGTGIRSFIDHYYLNKKLKPNCNTKLLRDGLKATGLEEFSKKADKLCEYWFEDGEGDRFTEEVERFVFFSGVFGNGTNHYIGGVIRGNYDNTKKSYFITRLFPPYKKMKKRYLILKKIPLLLPFFWMVRIVTAILNPHKFSAETKTVMNTDESLIERQKAFMEDMGLY